MADTRDNLNRGGRSVASSWLARRTSSVARLLRGRQQARTFQEAASGPSNDAPPQTYTYRVSEGQFSPPQNERVSQGSRQPAAIASYRPSRLNAFAQELPSIAPAPARGTSTPTSPAQHQASAPLRPSQPSAYSATPTTPQPSGPPSPATLASPSPRGTEGSREGPSLPAIDSPSAPLRPTGPLGASALASSASASSAAAPGTERRTNGSGLLVVNGTGMTPGTPPMRPSPYRSQLPQIQQHSAAPVLSSYRPSSYHSSMLHPRRITFDEPPMPPPAQMRSAAPGPRYGGPSPLGATPGAATDRPSALGLASGALERPRGGSNDSSDDFGLGGSRHGDGHGDDEGNDVSGMDCESQHDCPYMRPWGGSGGQYMDEDGEHDGSASASGVRSLMPHLDAGGSSHHAQSSLAHVGALDGGAYAMYDVSYNGLATPYRSSSGPSVGYHSPREDHDGRIEDDGEEEERQLLLGDADGSGYGRALEAEEDDEEAEDARSNRPPGLVDDEDDLSCCGSDMEGDDGRAQASRPWSAGGNSSSIGFAPSSGDGGHGLGRYGREGTRELEADYAMPGSAARPSALMLQAVGRRLEPTPYAHRFASSSSRHPHRPDSPAAPLVRSVSDPRPDREPLPQSRLPPLGRYSPVSQSAPHPMERHPFQLWVSQHATRLLLPHYLQDVVDLVEHSLMWPPPPSVVSSLPDASGAISAASGSHAYLTAAPAGYGDAGEAQSPATRLFGKRPVSTKSGDSSMVADDGSGSAAPGTATHLHPTCILNGQQAPIRVQQLLLEPCYAPLLLASLPGVDPKAPSIQAVLTALQGRPVPVFVNG